MNLSACPRNARSTPVKRGRWLTGSALGIAAWAIAGSAALAQQMPHPELPGTVNSSTNVDFGAITNEGSRVTQTITQSGQRAVINWSDFNLTSNQDLTFAQPNASAIVLNRVTGGSQSTISGNINATGQVWLLNPSGVFVGSGGSISAHGFLGTTHSLTMSDPDFLASGPNSNYAFTDPTANATSGPFAEVVNEGQINALQNGYAVLAGHEVRNSGLVAADLGFVVLAGEPAYTMNIGGGSLLSFVVNAGDYDALSDGNPLISQLGNIRARGGRVLMTAAAADAVVASVVNMSGNVDATTVFRDGNGNLSLVAGSPTSGSIVIDGGEGGYLTIDGTAPNSVPTGGVLNVNSSVNAAPGTITVLGNDIRIGLTTQAKLLATGLRHSGGSAANGGRISIGKTLLEGFDEATARHIQIGDGFGTGFDANGLPYVELQAASFGGSGSFGGEISLATTLEDPTASISIAGFLNVGSDPFLTNIADPNSAVGGVNGKAGRIDVAADNVTLAAGGRLLANAGGAGGTGGLVQMTGKTISIVGNGISDQSAPTISAGGGAAAGKVFIGGDLSGAHILGRDLPTTVSIGANAAIYTEVFGSQGNGGTISIWSDMGATGASTSVLGRVSARSAAGSGNGGTIEIGGRTVDVKDNARIEAGADGNGGDIRLIGDAINVATFASLPEQPKGIFAAGFGGAGGTISIGAGLGGMPLAGKPLPTSVTISDVSRMNVRSINSSAGSGRITIWSDPNNPNATTVLTGGQFVGENLGSGAAGLVEIGGFKLFASDFSATAPGAGGLLRFVTHDVDIAFDPTIESFPESETSIINSLSLKPALDNGTNVAVVASAVGGQAPQDGNIRVSGSILKGFGPDVALTLAAANEVGILSSIKVFQEEQSAPGRLNLTVKAGHNISAYNFFEQDPAPEIVTNGGNVVFELGGDPNGPGDGNEDGIYNALAIRTGGGAVTFRSLYNLLQQSSVDLYNSGQIVTSGGAVTFNGGHRSFIDNYGTIDSGAGNISLSVGDGAEIYLEQGSGIYTTTGDVALVTGVASDIYNFGEISSDASQLGLPSGDISFTVGDSSAFYNDTFGYSAGIGYGSFATQGGQVTFTGGRGSTFDISGDNSTNGGAFTATLGADSYLSFDDFFSTSGGNLAINTGGDSYVYIAGLVSAASDNGGNISINVGDDSYVGIEGTLETAGGAISLTGESGTEIGNYGTISSGGGAISLAVGDAVFDGSDGYGYGYYDGGIYNAGNFDTGGGDLSLSAGADGYIETGYSGGTILTFGGDASFSVGDDGYIDMEGYGHTGGGQLSFAGGNGAEIRLSGDFTTSGGDISVRAGTSSEIDLGGNFDTSGGPGGDLSVTAGHDSAIYYFGETSTGGGNVTMAVGDRSGIVHYGYTSTSGGDVSFTAGNGDSDVQSGFINFGFVDTSKEGGTGGDFTVTAGNDSFSQIVGEISTGGGNIAIRHGANSSIDIGTSDCVECEFSYPGSLDAGSGDIELTADTISIAGVRLDLESSLENGISLSGANIRLNADSLNIEGQLLATSSIAVAPRTLNRAINIGGTEDMADSLSLTDFELDNIDAPTVTLGRADGTGAVSIFLSPDVDDVPDDSVDPPSTTIVQAGGVGGTITVYGQGATDANETIRLVAGSNITLADDFGLEVNGKLELVSGGSFVNNAGADALTTPAGGQWLIYSADPSLDTFGGLLSGQTAIWGRGFTDVAANGIVHSGNRYAFGLAPTLTISAVSRSKTYGDALDLSSAVLGRDYRVEGLIDAAAYGNVFEQDRFSGSLALTSTGAAAGANAGAYAITVSGGSGFSPPTGYTVSFLSSTLTVNRRLLTASLANASKVYDGTTTATLGATNYSLAGVVNGDEAAVAIAGAQGIYDSKNVGTGKTVTVSGLTLTGDKASNYELSSTTLSGAVGTITPKALTVSLVGSTSKAYDATTAAALSAANYSLAGFIEGESGSVNAAGGTYASANVGSGLAVSATLTATDFTAGTGTSLSNYQLPTTASGAIGSITPATLTYVANPVTRDRGAANPALTGSVTGFVGGETQATATTGTLAFTTTATAASPTGNYAINGGGLTAGNYVFVQAPGNADALRVNEGAAPAQQVTTTVIQQVTTSTRTPTPAPAQSPAPVQPPVNPPAPPSVVTAGNTPPPPPPPQPPAATGGNPPSPPAGPAVESTPPSPVGDTPPETPSDAADQGDPVLAEAEAPEEEQDEAPSEKRQLANTTTVAPGVDVEVPAPPRSTEVPGAEQSFSGSGNPAQW